jgi:hypothetical protein
MSLRSAPYILQYHLVFKGACPMLRGGGGGVGHRCVEKIKGACKNKKRPGLKFSRVNRCGLWQHGSSTVGGCEENKENSEINLKIT